MKRRTKMRLNDETPEAWDRAYNAGKPKAWSEVFDGKLAEDNVNKPPHYNSGDIEAIDAIKASMSPVEFKGYLKGNALKYIWRYRYKGKPVEDLKKCQWYLKRLTEEQE